MRVYFDETVLESLLVTQFFGNVSFYTAAPAFPPGTWMVRNWHSRHRMRPPNLRELNRQNATTLMSTSTAQAAQRPAATWPEAVQNRESQRIL